MNHNSSVVEDGVQHDESDQFHALFALGCQVINHPHNGLIITVDNNFGILNVVSPGEDTSGECKQFQESYAGFL